MTRWCTAWPLLKRCPVDDWQKFANLRAYYTLMWGYPGKKLLFMGQEFAQRREWSENGPLDWELLDAPAHAGVRRLVRDLNRLYRDKPALHARDCESDGFAWAVVDDKANSVFAWTRRAPGAAPIAVIANMTPVERHEVSRICCRADGALERNGANSDAPDYGGSGIGNLGAVTVTEGHAVLTLPPLATIMLEHVE